jgi:hypothetical protein
MDKPSVGRIVHYVSYGTPGGEYGQQCRAAIVTEVHGPTPVSPHEEVSLAVMNPTGMFFNQYVRQSDQHAGGTWHWPERVEG